MKNLIKKACSIAAELGFRDTLRLIWVILFKWSPPFASENEIQKADFLLGFEFEPSSKSLSNKVLAGIIQEYELRGIEIPSVVQAGIEEATHLHCARNAVIFQGYKRVDSMETARQADLVNETLGRPWKKVAIFSYEDQILRCKWLLETMGYEVLISEKIKQVPMNQSSNWGQQARTRFSFLWRPWERATRVHHVLNGYIDPRIMIR